jgi:hypothetical protein
LGKKIKLSISENLSSIPLNGACSSFPIAACDSKKGYSEAAGDTENDLVSL